MALRDDLIYAARSLRKTPVLVSVIVLTLALGIGVNTTAFNLLNLLVLSPPSAKEPDRLLRIEPGNGNLISYLNFRDMAGSSAFTGMALASPSSVNWRNGDGVEPVQVMLLSANCFSFSGTSAWLGRTFTAEDAAPERNPNVVVLSYEFWQRQFSGDPDVLGRTLNLNGRSFAVIGVMQHGYRAVMGSLFPQMFVPIGPAVASGLDNRQASSFSLIARLAPGVGREQARSAFTAMAKALEKAYPRENAGFGEPAYLFPVSGLGSLQERNPNPQFSIGLAVPFVVAGLLLLIACANVAGVMLARGVTRQREIAMRLALGASRARVVRLLLADSLLLSILGAGGALLVTAWLTPLLAQIRIANAPALPPFDLHLDMRLALYMLAVVVATVVFCGLIPARQASRPQILPWLKQSTLPGTGSSGLRRILVSGQVGVSALLLTICLVFLHSLLFIGNVNPGFDIDHGITASVTPEQKNITSAQTYGLTEELVARVKTLPGVESASFASLIPLSGDSFAGGIQLKDRPDFRSPMILFSNVGPAYFRTMGVRVLGGREFQTSDRQGAPAVAIVNQTFARIFFPNGDALGKSLRAGDAEPWREVVGVVADNKYEFYAETPKPQFFSPFLQTGGRILLQVRTVGAPSGSIGAVRRVIAEMDRSLVTNVQTTRDATSLEFTMRRISTALLAAMGTLGLILSMIGLYGVISWEVSRRTAEIGIRIALGASRSQVRRMVLRSALMPVGFGIVTGIGAAMLAALPLHSFLAGVSTIDPVTIGGVVGLLIVVSLGASWFPMWRATRVDPMTALRYE